jgi:chlorobactene glucosyltransferase
MLPIALQLTPLAILSSPLWFVALVWLGILVLSVHGLRRQRSLLPATSLRFTSIDAPLMSILVPARNEQHRVLEQCIRSILAQDYGRFEVIAVNDRSTDETGTILETLAQSDQRLRVIEGQALPSGWLGKPYAMHQH